MANGTSPAPECAVPNLFGRRFCPLGAHPPGMSRSTTDADDLPVAAWLEATAAPGDRPIEPFDARELPPPEPLSGTMERLAELDDDTVFLQVNDRAPQLLYPKLEDRGWQYDTAEVEAGVVTAVWK